MDEQNQNPEVQPLQTLQPLPPTPPSPEPTPAADSNPVSSPPTPPPPSTPNTATPISSTPPNKSHKLRSLIFAVILLLIFGAVIWAAIQITNKNQAVVAPTVTKHDVADLRVASDEPFPATFYPNMSTDVYTQEVNAQAFEGLTKFVNQTQIVPDLATSWTNPNTTTWVFKLRQGVKFHDGNTMTATQVVASLIQVKNYPAGQAEVPYTIKTVTAIDPYTVQIITAKPDPLLDRELTQFWIWDTSDTKTPNNPINGTGPYTLKPGTKLTSTSLQYVAYDNYQGGRPTTRELDFYEVKNPQDLVTGLQQNKFDITDMSDWYDYAQQAKNNGFKLFNVIDPIVYYIVPNTVSPGPLQNIKVRQAIYMTMNPVLLAKAHNSDVGTPATQLIPPSIPGYNPNIKRPAINIAAAKTLMDQAGYPNGFSTVYMYYSPSQDGVAAELQKELSAIGIKLILTPETDVNVLGEKVENASIGMYAEGDTSVILDTSDVASAFVIDTPEFSNPTIDALFNQAQQTFNPTTRLQLLQQLNADVINDLAIFPIYTPTYQYFAYRPGLVLNQQYLGGGLTGLYYWQVYSTK